MINRFFFYSIFFLFAFLFAQGQKDKTIRFKVTGNITHTEMYCGGARPSEEMLAEFNKRKAYAGKVFYIKKGAYNKGKALLKCVSDSSGKFTFKLPPGIYCLVQEEMVNKLNYSKLPKGQNIQVDKVCLKECWKSPLVVIELKDKDLSDININFHHRCFLPFDIPCLTYIGPMPP